MSYKGEEVKNLALLNKKKLINKFFKVPSGGKEYKSKISGIGSRFIKVEKFFYYNEIIKKVSDGNEHSLEFAIEQIIIDPNKKKKPVLESKDELRERALANKSNLKQQYIDAFIGKKEYEFRIAGIGFKSIKLELYIGYDEIASEISLDNPINLEFILFEKLMGNDVDYSKFNQLYDEEDLIFIEDHNVEEDTKNEEVIEDEINIDDIKKLSADEFDEKIVNVRGWLKLVFDSIDDFLDDTFTMESLLKQKRIVSYQTSGEGIEEKVLDYLNQLMELGLVAKINKTTYIRLW